MKKLLAILAGAAAVTAAAVYLRDKQKQKTVLFSQEFDEEPVETEEEQATEEKNEK